MYLSKLGMMSSEEATKSLTSALKGFHLAASDSLEVVDKLTKVDMNAAASAGDIASMLRNYASTATLAGLDLDQAIAMGTTILDVSQKDSGSVGNALRTVLSRYGNVKAGAYTKLNLDSDSETGENLNDIEKVLHKIGISIRDSQLDMRDFGDVLDELAEKWKSLDEVSKNAIATAFAGTRQRESFLVLMENYDKYQNLLDVSKNAKGTATNKYQAYQESYEASKNRLTAAWEDFTQSSGVIKILTKLVNFTADIVEWLPEIVRWMRRFAVSKLGKALGNRAANFLLGPNARSGEIGGLAGGIMAMIEGVKGVGGSGIKKFFGQAKTAITGTVKAVIGAHKGASEASSQARNNWFRKKLGLPTRKSSSISDITTGAVSDQGQDDYFYVKRNKKGKARGPLGGLRVSDQEKKYKGYNFDPSTDTWKKGVGTSVKWEDLSWADKQAFGAVGGGIDKAIDVDVGGKTVKMGYDANGNIVKYNKNGTTYTYKPGSKAKAVQAFNKQQAGAAKNAAMTKAAGYAAVASAGIQVGASIANAMLQSYDTYRVYNSETGKYESRESSAESSKAQRISNTVATTLLGPTLGGLVGDWIGNAIAKENDRRSGKTATLKVSERGQKEYTGLRTFGQTLSNISDTIKKGFKSVEDYNKTKQEVDRMMADFMSKDNNYARLALQKQLDKDGQFKDVNELMDKMLNGTEKERKAALKEAEIAQAQAEAEALAASKEKELWDLGQRANKVANGLTSEKSKYSRFWSALAGFGMGAAAGAAVGAGVGSAAAGVGAVPGAIIGAIGGGLAGLFGGLASDFLDIYDHVREDLDAVADDIKNKDIDTAIASVENKLAYYQEEATRTSGKGLAADQEMISYLSGALNELRDIRAQTKAILDEMNTAYVNAGYKAAKTYGISGIKDGTYLSDLTSGQLKRLTQEDIEAMIAYATSLQGGLYGYSIYDAGGNLTTDALRIIDTVIKQDEKLYNLINGSIYTLNEAFGMKDGRNKDQILENFAIALGVTVNDLANLASKWGNIKLADMNMKPSETREQITALAGLFSSMASSSGLVGENLEKIINDFPELIQYLGDSQALMENLIKDINLHKEIYAKNIFKSIADSESYGDLFKRRLEETIGSDAFNALNATAFGETNTISDIVGLMVLDAKDSGIDPKTKAAMEEIYNELFDIEIDNTIEKEIINTVINYQNKVFDLQIKNLTEQKEALSEINNQREYEIKLIEAKMKLEEAQREKKRVWREGVGKLKSPRIIVI